MVKSQHFSVYLLGQSSGIFGTEDWTHDQEKLKKIGVKIVTEYTPMHNTTTSFG